VSAINLAMSEAELKWLVRYFAAGGKMINLSYPWRARINALRNVK
jgi:hypothetical protein